MARFEIWTGYFNSKGRFTAARKVDEGSSYPEMMIRTRLLAGTDLGGLFACEVALVTDAYSGDVVFAPTS